MKRLLSLIAMLLILSTGSALAIKVSTDKNNPEALYTMCNANGLYANGSTGTTQTAANYGQFAFFEVDGKAGAYYIYSKTAGKWVVYTQAASYSNQQNFVRLNSAKLSTAYYKVNEYETGKFELQPYTSSGTTDKYINWNGGKDKNPLDTDGITLGLWQQSGSADAGSRWTFEEVINLDPVDPVKPEEPEDLQTILAKYGTGSYTLAKVYPQQQDAVGEAKQAQDGDVYTLYNNVLAASFLAQNGHLTFAGSKAMNLEPGTEIFKIAVGSGTEIPASGLEYKTLEVKNLAADANATGGAEHYAGKALEATFEYAYGSAKLNITWRAVLRDGSHYVRTEMQLDAVDGDVKMFNVIPMIYDVDTKTAGSAPAVVGNTRGAVLMSNKIFAGLEHPTAYNTVGDADDGDSWEVSQTQVSGTPFSLTAASWTDMDDSVVPDRMTEVTGKTKADIRHYIIEGVTLAKNQKVEVTVTYKSGANKLYIAGMDIYRDTEKADADAYDYHRGYAGSAHTDNVYSCVAPYAGTYKIRLLLDGVSESVTASSEVAVKLYTPKEGAEIKTDIVTIQGRWSRNTTLLQGENWKISGVVGLIAQDKNSAVSDYTKNQKRRSFLAYSERERAVPWRCNPAYISWYELNINRNNAAPGSEPSNMQADQVLDIEKQWKEQLYDKYGVGPNSFVIDDGWDTYGEWQFHSAFPNEMRDISAKAAEMGAGVGAWLGPVGGYGQSGTYRRNYWSSKGGMVLGNPAYYQVFKTAATNLVKNQGKKKDGTESFQFFKFDGISAQFSATGPDAGDSGNENAEGIIRLERYVREDLKRDIFFNTTVGTWASPFWFHYTDAVWRQENDHGTIGDNAINREKWITYRDRLVYQNFVQNSPICPINTLMTHGFILTNYSATMNNSYDACLRELRCAFACGSGMVELYNDYSLMNSIADNNGNKGALWKDLANLIEWQKANADVLPDAHWVGGNPWDGSNENIYGWGAWNGGKAVLTLRNGDDGSDSKQFKTTLREALNIPASVTGTITLKKTWSDQPDLAGWPQTEAIDIDTELTLTLPKNTVYMFGTVTVTEKEIYHKYITKLSDLSNTKTYVISTAERGFLMNSANYTNQIAGSVGSGVKDASTVSDANRQFALFNLKGSYYLYSVGAGKFVSANGAYEESPNTPCTFVATGNANYPWSLKLGSNTINMQGSGGRAEGVVVNSWSTLDAGNQMAIEEVGNLDFEIEKTYTVRIMGAEDDAAGVVLDGNTYKAGDSFTYVLLNASKLTAKDIDGYYASAVINGNDVVVSYISKDETFYTIVAGNGSWVSTGYNTAGNLTITNTTKPAGSGDGLWLIKQQQDNTYRFYNVSSGLSKVLGMTGSEANARATMVAEDAEGYTTKFDGQINLDGTVSYIKLSGTANNYWNKRGDYLALWNNSGAVGDNGSKFYISMVDAEDFVGKQYADFHTINKGSRPSGINKYSLWYDESAPRKGVSDTWMEYALPLGNGQIGVTFTGGVYCDKLQFNEKTLWEGTTANSSQGYYQNFGTIRVTDKGDNFSLEDDSQPVNDYARYLDIIDGVGGVNYTSASGSKYERRYFTSAPDRVFVAHYEIKEGDDKLHLQFKYDPDNLINASAVTYTDNDATFSGALSTVKYNTRFVIVTDGQKSSSFKGIEVQDATYVDLIMAAATDYDVTKTGAVSGETAQEIADKVQTRINEAKAKGYETLYNNNKENYNSLMGRVDLNIGGASEKTTEELINFYNQSSDNKNSADGLFLETLYFQYGRYFTVAANNDQSIHAPSNLQGIWNDRSNTNFWHCDVHADINVEMNYWPADPTNLSEMHKPFVEHILDLASAPGSPWKALAKKLGGTSDDGWTVACENNIFGGTSTWCNGSMKTLGSWYVSHLWRYYQYSHDTEFLQRALPVMYANCKYTMEIAGDDTSNTSPGGETTLQKVILGEWSPEHGDGGPNAFAQQTASEAVYNTLAAYKALTEAGISTSVTAEQIDALSEWFETFDKGIHIENYTWTRGGQTYTDQPCISEWLHIALTDPGHRHLSHLMCVYPFAQITAYGTTDLEKARFEAAKNGILARNGDVTGWSMGWQTNVYARCLQGDQARSYLSWALRHSRSYVIAMGGEGGCYYNLFDAHSPFQIDGNYGCTSGVAEMLLQSYDDVITFLPALPTAWAKGSVKGLKAQGNFIVDEEWDCTGERKIITATITSKAGAPLAVRCVANEGDKVMIFNAEGKQVQGSIVNGILRVNTNVGDTFRIMLNVASIDDVTKLVKQLNDGTEGVTIQTVSDKANEVLKK